MTDTLDVSLPLFGPELVLCGTIVLLLLVRVFRGGELIPPVVIALLGSLTALVLALPTEGIETWTQIERQEIFTGMLVYDSMTAFAKVFLLSFAVLFVILAWLTGIADSRDGQDFYALVFGATIGLSIMVSANHMLMVFLGIEMASIPSFVLSGMVKGRRRSSEAALKFAIYGSGTAGIMLYGISLLAGVLGTVHLPSMGQALAEMDMPVLLTTGDGRLIVMVLALGALMLGVGLAFKLSAVPFHFWCPDVFEGASAEVNAFLSVASKAAALILLLRLGLAFGYVPVDSATESVMDGKPAAIASVSADGAAVATQAKLVAQTDALAVEEFSVVGHGPLAPARRLFVYLVGIIAIVTCTFGNLAAYGQTNIKRMLAYSTIAHAGFMMMAIAPAIALVGRNPADAQTAVSALLLYISIYLFMNLGAFAIVAFLRNAIQSEEIADYGGLIRTNPILAVMMTAILVSLIGIPPLAGFWPKLRVLQALYIAGGPLMMFILVAAALNSAIALVYYLRVAKAMCIDPEPDTRGPVQLGFLPAAYVLVVSLPVIVFGIIPDWIAKWTNEAATMLFS